MLLSRYVVVAINGVNNMRTSWRTIQPKGIEDYLNDLCKVYRGEEDNPHDINATCEDERVIQILRYHLWDVEKSVMESAAYETNIAHYKNFIDCIRSRHDPIVPVEVGHSSCTLCNIGNIAYELNRPLKWNPAIEKFMDDEEANSKLHYEYRAPYKLE